MYKVFIVDDESLVITSLQSCVNWEALGFSVEGEANDGISAYNKILEMKPDIVFADIRMPGMSGLDLVKKVYSQNPKILFVIISGYAEFAYVQKALSYGVLGYCLKPFDEDEIAALLTRVKGSLGKSKAALEIEFIGLINDTDELACSRIKCILEMLGLQITPENGLVAVVSIGLEKLSIPANINYIRVKLGHNKVAYLFQNDSYEQCIRYFETSRPTSIRGIGLSKTCYSEDTISDAIEEACIAANQYFMTGKSGVCTYRDYSQERLNVAFSQLENAIVKKDIVFIQKALDGLEAEMSKGTYDVKNAFQVYNIFMYSFFVLNSEKYESCLFDYEQLVRSFEGIHGMFKYFKSLLHEFSGVKAGPLPSSAKGETFSNIMSYVNEHFCEDISIHTLSTEYGVNPNYVSQLFKKQTGETFTEYITNLKVKFACTLLRTTDLNISEVADRVGFNDYYYFTRVFKKNIGETPSYYRDKHLMKG